MLRIFEEDGLMDHIRARIPIFAEAIGRFRDHPMVADVRTLGLAGAVQLKAETNGEGAGGTASGIGKALAAAALDRGLIVRVTGSSIVIAPPLIITDDEIADLFERLERALQDVERATA